MVARTFMPDSEDDWNITVNVDWARGFSDIVEFGPSEYDLIRIWQNDPAELETFQPGRPPHSLVVRWLKRLSEEVVLHKLISPEERENLPGHVNLLIGRTAVKWPQTGDGVVLTSTGSGASRFGKILNALNVDLTFRSTLYKSLPDFRSYEYGEVGLCYQLKFPSLYRGEFAFAAWFSCKFNPGPQYPRTGHTNALIIGLSHSQIGNVLARLTETDSTVLRTENSPPAIVYHPLLLISAILSIFSEEDISTMNKSIDHLENLQQKISLKIAQDLGDISIELNQLSSTLRVIQMGNTYMKSLATSLLATSCVVISQDGNEEPNHNLSLGDIERLTKRQMSESMIRNHPNSHNSTRKCPWLPLTEQFSHIKIQLELLQIRCEEQQFDMECLQKQIDINLNVAYNLLSQEENRWNRTISKQMAQDSRAMHEIALASKNIAEATKRDSYAMKTIAVLTTLFLPGTFVAALFSSSMFSFDTGSIQVSRLFWLYWAVTIPLTLFVVIVWRLWLRITLRRHNRLRGEGEQLRIKEE